MLQRLFGKKSAPNQPQRRRFDAAAINRLTAGWLTDRASIDQELKSDLDRLRSRSRDLANNNPYVKKFLQMVGANIVGPNGFLLQARVMQQSGQPDGLANAALEAAFYRWSRYCDASGRLSWPDMCRLLAVSLARDGEVLLRKVRGQPGNPYGYALQVLDIDRLDTGYNIAAATGRNAVVMGVELDVGQRPVAFWLFTAHPQGGQPQRERIAADDIIHRYIVQRPEQTRGYPWAHAVMRALHDLNEYNASALMAARKGADTLGFFVTPDGETPPGDGTDDDTGEDIQISVPGQWDTLPQGVDVRPFDSKYPDANYGEFVKAHLRTIATGLGVSYNTLAEDLEGVNFSSIRSGVIAERDQWMALQSWFIDALLVPIYEEWLQSALLMGAVTLPNGSALPISRFDKFVAHSWQGRRWQWVDPMKDIEAARLAVQSGVSSPQAIAAQMGMDVEDVLADIKRFEDSVAQAGIKSVGYKDAAPAAVAPADAPEVKAAGRLADAMVRVAELQRDAPAMVINNHQPAVHVAPPEVRNEITVEAPAVPVVNVAAPEVRNEITVPAAEVRVEAAAPVVNVAAPEVTVHVEAVMPEQNEITIVAMPDRQTTVDVERDSSGNIQKTTQLEQDKKD